MTKWLVRVATLYIFNVAVLFLIDLIVPSVSIGWAALWGALILTAATLWVKPASRAVFTRLATTPGKKPNFFARKLTEYLIAFAVALIVWVLVVMLSGVRSPVFSWGTLLAPLALLVAWFIYDLVDGALERTAGNLVGVDMSDGKAAKGKPATTNDSDSTARERSKREFRDGLTDEQRRMFDEL